MSKEENENFPEEVSFTAPPSKHGKYYIFHIPNQLIKSGEINPNFYYKVKIKPIKRKDKIGKFAGMFILNELKKKYKDNEKIVIKKAIAKKPYDLLLNKEGIEYFIGVKSSGSNEKIMRIDERLLEFAKEKGNKFILYHVINFATDNPTYVEFENFYDQYITNRFNIKKIEKKLRMSEKTNNYIKEFKLFY